MVKDAGKKVSQLGMLMIGLVTLFVGGYITDSESEFQLFDDDREIRTVDDDFDEDDDRNLILMFDKFPSGTENLAIEYFVSIPDRGPRPVWYQHQEDAEEEVVLSDFPEGVDRLTVRADDEYGLPLGATTVDLSDQKIWLDGPRRVRVKRFNTDREIKDVRVLRDAIGLSRGDGKVLVVVDAKFGFPGVDNSGIQLIVSPAHLDYVLEDDGYVDLHVDEYEAYLSFRAPGGKSRLTVTWDVDGKSYANEIEIQTFD